MKPFKVIALMLLVFSLVQTDQDTDQVELIQETTLVDSSADKATPVLIVDTEETFSTVTEQTTTDVISDQSTTITPTSVESVSSTTYASHDSDQTTTKSAIQADAVEPSQSVIYMTAQSVTDQSETVTQSTPIDQLETPLQTEEKSPGDKEQIQDESKPEGISGEDVLKVIKSLPEQPNGLHGTDQILHVSEGVLKIIKKNSPMDCISMPDQILHGSEGLPGVTEMPDDPDHKKESEEDDGLTFNEWTQKELAKGEIEKQNSEKEDIPVKPKVSSSKQRKKKNYASSDCGAKVLASNPESTNSKGILNSNKDDYMINPCKVKKWVVIELCEPIQAYSVDVASLELFSSQPRKFKIYLSDRYPTKDWKFAGEKDLTDERSIQSFDISESHDYFAKFVKVELVDHYGDEHFCPLTILKVFGVAVTDYDDNHEETESDNLDDEDHVIGGEIEEDSKNLFDSARDTVMTLVKKVLNVDPKDEANNNKTNTENVPGVGLANGSLSSNINETQPALPNASIPYEELKDDEVGMSLIQGQGIQGQGETLPEVPQPGKTDSVSIVTKLEDDEQVETGSAGTDWDWTFIANGTILDKFIQCKNLDMNKNKGKQRCRKISTFCQFICLVFKTAAKISFQSDNRITVKKGKQKIAPEPSKTEQNVPSELEKIGPSGISSSEYSSETSTINQSLDTIETKQDGNNARNDFTAKVGGSSDTESLKATTVNVVDDSRLDEIKDSLTQSIVPTATLEPILQTETEDQSTSPLTMHVPSEPLKTEQTKSDTLDTQSDDTILVDPSQTSVAMEIDIGKTSLEQDPTPSLPDSWKPDTKDLLETGTLSATESRLESTDLTNSASTSTKDVSDTASTSDKQQSSGESTLTSSDISTETSQEISSSSISPSSTVPEPSKTLTDVPTAEKPTVGVPEVTDQVAAGSSVDKQVQTSDGKVNQRVDREEVKGTNITAAEEKPEGQKIKPDRNFDIKVPPMSGTSRESAIMRLSNRIKVLEQNVSLSSRFLEELSKRYKKQSEDMMKLLNKTLAKLANMTVENEVKNKIHDDEMYAMERRLENLTERVSTLTNSLQTLNQQVTDRQMIATTVEILIILVLFLILGRRGHKEMLTPEIQKLIESMPPKAKLNLPQRRNSVSGTPSKKLSSDCEPGGLNKFPSETSLDLRIVEPSKSLFGNQKLPDAVKKKKKKKQKLPDGRASWTGFETLHTNQSAQDEKSKNLLASLNLQTEPHKKIITKKKLDNTGDWSIGVGAIPKKAPLHGGRKKDEDSRSVGSPNTARRDKQFQKGHRRQKSLPKQHFSDEEFRVTAFRSGQMDPLHSDIGTKYQTHSDKHLAHGKSFTKPSSRRHSDNILTLSNHESCVAKGKKFNIHNGFSDISIKETVPRQEIQVSKSTNSMSTQEKSACNIDLIGPSITSAINTESHKREQQSSRIFNGFNELGSDIDYIPDVFIEPSPSFLLHDSSHQDANNGGVCFDSAEGPIGHDLEPQRQNGNIDHFNDSNNSNLSEKKGYRKLWGLLR